MAVSGKIISDAILLAAQTLGPWQSATGVEVPDAHIAALLTVNTQTSVQEGILRAILEENNAQS